MRPWYRSSRSRPEFWPTAGVVAYLRFREPLLHKFSQPESLRRQLSLTVRSLTRNRRLLPIVTLAALSGVSLQLILEFGPLWLVAREVPAVFYGPYWAGLVSTLGLGGVLAGWIRLDRTATAATVGSVMTAAALVLTMTDSAAMVMLGQLMLALNIVAAGIHITRLLHDEIPSAVRTGVASGVSAISWMVFLPVALGFGLISSAAGLQSAGWLLVGLAALTGVLLTVTARWHRPIPAVSDRDGAVGIPPAHIPS